MPSDSTELATRIFAVIQEYREEVDKATYFEHVIKACGINMAAAFVAQVPMQGQSVDIVNLFKAAVDGMASYAIAHQGEKQDAE